MFIWENNFKRQINIDCRNLMLNLFFDQGFCVIIADYSPYIRQYVHFQKVKSNKLKI